MRFGFAPEMEEDDAEIVNLGTGMAIIDEAPPTPDPDRAYVKLQLGSFVMEWRIW